LQPKWPTSLLAAEAASLMDYAQNVFISSRSRNSLFCENKLLGYLFIYRRGMNGQLPKQLNLVGIYVQSVQQGSPRSGDLVNMVYYDINKLEVRLVFYA
jgi:hypothetical protein